MSRAEHETLLLPTERGGVFLRQLTKHDVSAYFDAVDASRDHLSQFGDPTSTKYQTIEDVETSVIQPDDPNKLRFGIWDHDSFTGSINLTLREDGSAEVGYWLDARFTGRGYATLATKSLVDFARSRYGRIYAKVAEGNDASCKVLERAGLAETSREVGKIVFTLIRSPDEELLESLGLENDEVDFVADFASDLKKGGLKGLAMSSPEGIQQFKDMYDQMWTRVADVLLASGSKWRALSSPKEQLVSLFADVWDLKKDEVNANITNMTFVLAFMDDRRDGHWGEIFGSTSYYGKSELLRTIEQLCRDGSFSAGYGPEHLATFLMNFVYTTYATWEAMPERGLDNREEWLDAIRGYLA